MNINSKLLREINYRDESVRIYGWVLYSNWREKDYVKLQAMLKRNGMYHYEMLDWTVYKPESYRKWFRLIKPSSTEWKERVEKKLVKMEKAVKDSIDEWKYKQEMTDGLTDSLAE